MKTYTKNLKIVKIERINSSCNGNPAYRMIVEDESGKQYEGRTASDAAIGYKLSTSDINQIYNIQYHYTKNNNIIFDRKTGFAIVHADSKKECIQKYEKTIERFRTLQKSKNYQIYINEYLELCRNYCNKEVEKIDDLFYQNLTEKQKENLKKIKEFLEKENQKAREHQKIRGVR